MTEVIEGEIVPGRSASTVRGLAAQGVGIIALLFATGCGFFFGMELYVVYTVVLAPLVVVAAWIIWRELGRRAWLAMVAAVIVAFLVLATRNAAPWHSVFDANYQLAFDSPITGGPTVGDLTGQAAGRFVLLVITSAISVLVAEGIHALVNRPARMPVPVSESPVVGASEVLKQVGTTEDGKPLYVTVSGPGIASHRYDVPRTNTLSVLALVFGLVGGLPAVPLGHIALHQIKRTRESGRGMAIAGLVLGYAWVAALVVYFIIIIVAVSRMRY